MIDKPQRQIRRVLLIYPQTSITDRSFKQCCLPLGIAYIAGALRDDYEVTCIDASAEGYFHEEQIGKRRFRYGLPMDELVERIKKAKPDLVGISTMFSSHFPTVAEICERVKELDPGIVTITGGAHPTFLPERSLKMAPGLDFVVLGEGEGTIRTLLKVINDGASLDTVPGLAYRTPEREIQIHEGASESGGEYLEEIGSLPWPARDLLPMDIYNKINVPMGGINKNTPWTSINSSRGCPARCTFCSATRFWGNRYRTRTAEDVLDELEHLVNDYGIREVKWFDDNLLADPERAKAIFQGMIDRKLNLTWNTPNGISVWYLDEEMVKLMKESGCYEATLAIESGDEDVLRKIVQKPMHLEDAVNAARLFRKYKINTSGFFIIGFPGETKEQIKRTLDFASRINLDRIQAFVANPLPGTQVFEWCMEKGYIDEDYCFEEADYFQGRFSTEEFTAEWLEKTRNQWYIRYNIGLMFRHPLKFYGHVKPYIIRPKFMFDQVLTRIFSIKRAADSPV